jgi:hypothetical protein
MRKPFEVAFLGLLLACNKAEPHPPTVEGSGSNPGGGVTPVQDGGPTAEAGGAFGVLASITSPTGIALDATYVYATDATGEILRVPRVGGGVDVLANGQASPSAVTLAANQLVFLSAGAIAAMALPQSAVSVFANDAISPTAITSTPTDVYWIELQQLGSSAIQLATRPIVGGAKRVVATITGHTDPGPVVVSNGYAYFGYSDAASGIILRTPLNAGGDTAEQFAVIPDGQIADLATDGTNLYVAVSNAVNGGKIQGTPLTAGGAVATLVPDAGGPRHIAVKNGIVYFTAGTAGEVRAVAVGGGNVAVIATGVDAPSWIAVDDASYVTFSGGIARLPR